MFYLLTWSLFFLSHFFHISCFCLYSLLFYVCCGCLFSSFLLCCLLFHLSVLVSLSFLFLSPFILATFPPLSLYLFHSVSSTSLSPVLPFTPVFASLAVLLCWFFHSVVLLRTERERERVAFINN